jgi:hypothetical protein
MRKALMAVAAASGLLGACNSKSDYEAWALPPFSFSDMPALGVISVTGTLKGPNLGYPVNSWHIDCYRDQMMCHSADVSEIGYRQLGSIWLSDWKITSWTDKTVVLASTDPTACASQGITFYRLTKRVGYVSSPINQETDYCRKYNRFAGQIGTDEWEIGQPRQPWDKTK